MKSLIISLFIFMHFLLLTDDVLKGEFILRGLRYEHLPVDLVQLKQINTQAKNLLMQYDGFFLYYQQLANLETLIDFCLKLKPGVPIIIMAPQFSAVLTEWKFGKHKIKNFFIRPFPFRLMAAEMRFFLFEHRERLDNGVIKVRELELNRQAHELKMNGQAVYLRHKEFALLEFLMLNYGKVLSRGTILENVWDRNANILTNTVDVHINKLRKKIHFDGIPAFIRTIPCAGYILS